MAEGDATDADVAVVDGKAVVVVGAGDGSGMLSSTPESTSRPIGETMSVALAEADDAASLAAGEAASDPLSGLRSSFRPAAGVSGGDSRERGAVVAAGARTTSPTPTIVMTMPPATSQVSCSPKTGHAMSAVTAGARNMSACKCHLKGERKAKNGLDIRGLTAAKLVQSQKPR